MKEGAKPVQKVEPVTLVRPPVPGVSETKGIAKDGARTTFQARDASLGRRRVPRRAFDSPVGVLLDGEFNIERSYQVGEGGMMVDSGRKVTAGQKLVLSFYLPAGTMIVVRGIVRNIVPADHSLPERYGIEFINLDFQYKREIRNFVASATGESGDGLG